MKIRSSSRILSSIILLGLGIQFLQAGDETEQSVKKLNDFFITEDSPEDLKLEILSYLSIVDLVNLSGINSQHRQIMPKFLTCIDFPYPKLHDDILNPFTNITSLNLNKNMGSKVTRLSPAGRPQSVYKAVTDASLSLLTKLVILNLKRNPIITDASVSLLTNITTLNLAYNTKITDRSLALLTNMTDLNLAEKFTSSGTHHPKITDESLSLLTNITILNLTENMRITDDSLSLLTNITNLNLSQRFNKNRMITDASLSLLTNLTILDISFHQIVVNRPSNFSLTITHTPTNGSTTNITTIVQQYACPTDPNQTIATNMVTDASLSHLTNLTNLNISSNQVITDASLSLLTNLTDLNLKKNPNITRESLTLLTNVTTLNLRKNDRISRTVLSSLTNLKNMLEKQ